MRAGASHALQRIRTTRLDCSPSVTRAGFADPRSLGKEGFVFSLLTPRILVRAPIQLSMKLLFILCLQFSLFASLMAAENAASHFVVKAVGDIAAADEKKIVDALEAVYAQISADLQTTPAQPFEILIYSTRSAYTRATGNSGASGSIEGAGKLHMLQKSRSGDKAETIAVHEFAHAVTLKLLMNLEPQPLERSQIRQEIQKIPGLALGGYCRI